MSALFLKRYRSMILLSIFFFYLGSSITLRFLRMDCVDAISTQNQKNSFENNVEYAVLILSGPNYEDRRNTIRATWSKFSSNIFVENDEKLYRWNHTVSGHTVHPNFIKFYFVIGTERLSEVKLQNLENENDRCKDLLLLPNLEDSYKKLAYKMVLSMQWLSNNLKNLKYVIKCDDDSFVRIDLIVRDLEAYAPEMNSLQISEYISSKDNLSSYKGLYWGYFNGQAKVFKKGKWQESNWFLCDHYLPYALGGGYVVSRSIVDYIARNADLLSYYISEDVSMGVWTAALDGINRVHDIRFDTEWKSRGCRSYMLVRHKQESKDMFEMYRTLVQTQGERLCKTDSTIRKSYYYKWDVLPSTCCK